MAKRKTTRKELLKQEDAFVAAANQSAAWVKSHRNQVIAASIAALVAIGGGIGAVEYFHVRDASASKLYKQALETLSAEISETGATGAGKEAYPSEKDRRAAAIAKFKKVTSEAPQSGVSHMAMFYLGDLQQQQGDLEAAQQTFADLVAALPNGDPLTFLAVERLAIAKENAGDLDGAIRALGRLVGGESRFYADRATFAQARLYAQKGDTQRARNLLERIQQEYPKSTLLDAVDKKLAQLGATPMANAESEEVPSEAVDNPTEAPAPPTTAAN